MSRHDASPTTDQVPSSLRVAGSVAVGVVASSANSRSWTFCAVGAQTVIVGVPVEKSGPRVRSAAAVPNRSSRTPGSCTPVSALTVPAVAELGDHQLLGQQMLDRGRSSPTGCSAR